MSGPDFRPFGRLFVSILGKAAAAAARNPDLGGKMTKLDPTTGERRPLSADEIDEMDRRADRELGQAVACLVDRLARRPGPPPPPREGRGE